MNTNYVPNDLMRRLLGNQEALLESENWMGAQSDPQSRLVFERDLLTTKLQALFCMFCSGQKLTLESFQLLILWVSVIGLSVVCLRPATLLRKRIWHRCFFVNFCEIFKNTFFVGHLRVNVSGNNITVFVFLISRMKASMRHRQTVRFLSSVYRHLFFSILYLTSIESYLKFIILYTQF